MISDVVRDDRREHGAPADTVGDLDLFRAGETIAERYVVGGLIGKGGMGEVYAARDISTGEPVALKTVLRERIGNEKVVARFYQEAELSRSISHENVLRIFDVIEIEQPETGAEIPCMVMELLEGETLSDRLQTEQRLSVDVAWPIVHQMASALAASHRAGVVHRDLKPDNVFLIPDRAGGVRAVLTDFGVARSATAAVASPTFDQNDSLTATNVILGTPFYMAPEQLELETATPATDIYTFGLVIYEMVTGTLPFLAHSTLQTVFRRVREDPASPREHVPDLPKVWEETILRCLERAPEDRFASADEIARALVGDAVAANPAKPVPTADGDSPVPVMWIAAAVAAVLITAVLILWLAG